ncbi:glycosyltransferase [Nocardioides sp. dk4132]|uniref:glycosyltransferase family 4 protein n=1 Tax=unclassified Nocardioides TaxID=2615069 RepID=UPI0012959AC9|nr:MULTISPECIES: glycosyltransferase family 4 protein [unclassified Nocardioides]MQW76407.1 glycosyltransferase [Nocardioides sp. dk4132]QGA07319.1 glycosyltransferase [Nocardioides sp. dk884]
MPATPHPPVPPPGGLRGHHAVVVNWRDLGHSLAGGSERYAWEFARALAEAGARVEFVTARERGQARREVCDGIRVQRGGGAFTFYLHAALALLRRRRTLSVVIDPECGIPAFSPLFVRRDTVVVMPVHHVHQEQFATYFPAPLAAVGQWLERVLMPRVYRRRRTLAVSESTRAEMVRQLGWRGEIDILANGAQVPDPALVSARDKDPDRVVVLGRLVPHKRVDLVLRVVRELAIERPGLHLDVCGKGPDLERLIGLAHELGIADRVRFHGFVAEETKREVLRRAALHVCASDIEGWGQVVIEAAGWGVPTVARDVPGLRDSIRDGHTGWLVPDEPDLDLVAARLADRVRSALKGLEQPEERAVTIRECQEWAGRFSWTRMHREALAVVHQELRRVGRG